MQFRNAHVKGANASFRKGEIVISFTIPLNEENMKNTEYLTNTYTGESASAVSVDIHPLQPSLLSVADSGGSSEEEKAEEPEEPGLTEEQLANLTGVNMKPNKRVRFKPEKA
jgi:hypothetical protein